jgi:Vacuolar protein sorting-associated protein 62
MPTDRDVLMAHVPVLQYDSHELYYADSARTLIENFFVGGPLAAYGNVLRRRDGTVIASASGDTADEGRLTVKFLAPEGGTYPNGEAVSPDDYLDASTNAYVADARRQHQAPGLGNVIYGAVRPGAGGKRWLQYWFFFYYNDKAVHGFGLHEGDWEGIQIRIGPGGPEEVTYSQHNDGERAGWTDVEIDAETGAPVVYVALASHASYLRAGSHDAPVVPDVCDASGARVRPTLEFFDDDETGWTHWPGRWGASKKGGLISFPSPDSPWKQRRWTHPDEYHRDAQQFDDRRGVLEETIAPVPVVVAKREGDVIHVDLNLKPGRAAKLVIPAIVDGSPQALEYDLSELPESESVTLAPVDQGAASPTPEADEDDRR